MTKIIFFPMTNSFSYNSCLDVISVKPNKKMKEKYIYLNYEKVGHHPSRPGFPKLNEIGNNDNIGIREFITRRVFCPKPYSGRYANLC